MQNEIQTTGNDPYEDMLRRMREQQDRIDAQTENDGYPAAYIRGLHNQSEAALTHGVGTLEISHSKESKLYGQVAAVLPIEIIGTVGEKKAANPTPRRWETPFSDDAAQEEFGHTKCAAAGSFTPDPMYTNPPRTLTHPGADQDVMIVSAGWGSKKTKEIRTTFIVTKDTDCRECIASGPQFYDDGTLALMQACRPKFSAVVNLLGLSGQGLLEASERGLAVVTMYKQAARTVFARRKKKDGSPHNDTTFQNDVGIPQAMEIAIKNKAPGGGFANVLMVPVGKDEAGRDLFQRYTLPLLLASKQYQNRDKKGKVTGISIIPFLYNPAESMRKYITDNPSDPDVVNKALFQAIIDFSRYLGVQDNQQQFATEMRDLLLSTTSIQGTDTEMLLSEHLDLRAEYLEENEDGLFKGRVKLTTPFQEPENKEKEAEEKEETTQQDVPAVFNQKIEVVHEVSAAEQELLRRLEKMQLERNTAGPVEEQVETPVEEVIVLPPSETESAGFDFASFSNDGFMKNWGDES